MSKIELGTEEFSAEEVKALYFDDNALVEPQYKLYRLDSKMGDRYYYTFNNDGTPNFFMSVTTFIHKAMPSNYFLVKWIAEMGVQRAEEYKIERGAYGTFLHMAVEELTINKKYPLDTLDKELADYVEKNEYPHSWSSKWYKEMKKDILSWAKFMIDHNVEPVAIEVMLASKEMGVAGALDLVCMMDVEVKGFHGEVYKSGDKKGQPKETKKVVRMRCIVDTKSGKKGFYESHELQLHTYKSMWEENYPELPIDRVFNWSGADWKSSPTYKLKDQTDSATKGKIEHFIQIAKIDAEASKNELLIVEGDIDIEKGIESNYRVITKDELVMSK